jgi:GWxTD domain-containing protein
MEKTVADPATSQEGNRMMDLLRYFTEPGAYHFSLRAEDLNDAQNIRTVETDLAIINFPKDGLSLSGIQFASSIKKAASDSGNVFCKNGFEIIPDPAAVYGREQPMLYYYLEAYNLPMGISGDSYKTRGEITDSDGHSLATPKPREQIKKKVNSSIEVGAANVSALSSGVYQFQFGILNHRDEVVRSVSKKFYVYNPEVSSAAQVSPENLAAAVRTSEFAALSEKQLDAEFDKAQYIAGDEERRAYKSITTVAGKQQYLYEFWERRDPSPATATNEYRQEYLRRIEYANENFRSYARPGWKTDRGRVYILHGPPNDVERFPNNPLSYSHEIWHYDDIEGGILFVFADLQEFGEYTQLHSTKRGEPMNANWENKIQKF